jgi:hypothetical protein
MDCKDEQVEACLREFAEQVDIEELLQGVAHPPGALMLYHGPRPSDRGVLYGLSAELADWLKQARIQ